MQWYANATDESFSSLFPGFRYNISGKPYFSIPANIPVTFEVVVLSSAFGAFFGMWILNGLPRLANPLFRVPRFKRVTNDKFFLMIEAADPKFNRAQTDADLNRWGASFVDECREDLTDQKMPTFLRTAGILLIFLLMIPPVMIFRAAGMTSRSPRMHIVPDMDWQAKFKTQTVSPNFGTTADPQLLFADGRVMRPRVPGTIGRGQLMQDSHYYQGIVPGSTEVTATVLPGVRTSLNRQEEQAAPQQPEKPPEPNWVTTFPPQVSVDQALLNRGQERFEIYCSVCHGYSGNGDGQVNVRALELAASGQAAWTAAKSLHDPQVLKDNQSIGRIFDTISNGRNTMGPYKDQISVKDRWAIVAYVKALQATGIKPPAPIAAADGKSVAPASDKSGEP
jgi:mono/diheme cytochrome c family protein